MTLQELKLSFLIFVLSQASHSVPRDFDILQTNHRRSLLNPYLIDRHVYRVGWWHFVVRTFAQYDLRSVHEPGRSEVLQVYAPASQVGSTYHRQQECSLPCVSTSVPCSSSAVCFEWFMSAESLLLPCLTIVPQKAGPEISLILRQGFSPGGDMLVRFVDATDTYVL